MIAWDEARGSIEAGDHTLACAVTRPRDEGRHPAVLLLPPLGAVARTGPLGSRRDGIAAILQSFAGAGFVTMRVDPCGVGESGGPAYAEASLEADLEGHRASLEAMAGLSWVDPDRVIVVGVSLGGAIAPLVVEGADVRAVIVYGAPSRRWSACLADGARRQLALAGLEGEALDREADRAVELYDLVLREGASHEVITRDHPDLARCRAAADLSARHLHGRALHYFRALDRVDPEAAWRRVRAPVLAVHGEHDFIVADDDHTRIAAWARHGTAVTLPGLDHDLVQQPNRAAAFRERGRGAVDPGAGRAMIAWAEAAIANGLYGRDAGGDTGSTEEVPR